MGYATIQFDLNKMSREQILSTQTKDKTDLTEIKKEIFFKMKNLAFFSNVCVVFTNCDDFCCDSTGNNSKQEEKMRDLFINFVNAELTDLESKLDKLICIFQRRSLNSFSKRLNLSNTHEFCFGKLLQEEKEGYFQRLIQLRLLKGDEELYGLSQYTEEWALDNLIAFGNRLLNALRFNQEICSEKFAKDVTFITNKSKQQGVSFEDLSGMGEVKALIRKTIEAPLIFEELYKNSPIKLSTNLLLYGPSGCGKTEIAKATAQELGLNFISVKGPELLDKYIGASEQAVRNIFEKASGLRPCILFFDEFDAIVPRRNSGSNSVTDRVVNQFLCYLDGVVPLEGVFIIAVTGRPDLLDPALIRPGRIDIHVFCGFPSGEDRKELLEKGLGSLKVHEECWDPENISMLVELTDGFTYGEICSVLKNIQVKFVNMVLEFGVTPQ
jgi:AAA+ superfamily predicted ATPase